MPNATSDACWCGSRCSGLNGNEKVFHNSSSSSIVIGCKQRRWRWRRHGIAWCIESSCRRLTAISNGAGRALCTHTHSLRGTRFGFFPHFKKKYLISAWMSNDLVLVGMLFLFPVFFFCVRCSCLCSETIAFPHMCYGGMEQCLTIRWPAAHSTQLDRIVPSGSSDCVPYLLSRHCCRACDSTVQHRGCQRNELLAASERRKNEGGIEKKKDRIRAAACKKKKNKKRRATQHTIYMQFVCFSRRAVAWLLHQPLRNEHSRNTHTYRHIRKSNSLRQQPNVFGPDRNARESRL